MNFLFQKTNWPMMMIKCGGDIQTKSLIKSRNNSLDKEISLINPRKKVNIQALKANVLSEIDP